MLLVLWKIASPTHTPIIPCVSSAYPSWFLISKINLNWNPCLKSSFSPCTSFLSSLGEGIPSRARHSRTTALGSPTCPFPRRWPDRSSAFVQAKNWLTSWTEHLEVNWEITIAAINPSVKRLTTVYPAFILLWLTTVNSTNTSNDTQPQPSSRLIAPTLSIFFAPSGP